MNFVAVPGIYKSRDPNIANVAARLARAGTGTASPVPAAGIMGNKQAMFKAAETGDTEVRRSSRDKVHAIYFVRLKH